MDLQKIPQKNSFESNNDKSEIMTQVINATCEMYDKVGYIPPWIGYFAFEKNQCVGTCGFKYPPKNNRVEIAYFTFPEFEGKGHATQMVMELLKMSNDSGQSVQVTARTLPERKASARVLEKNGFKLVGEVNDVEDGIVWEWIFRK